MAENSNTLSVNPIDTSMRKSSGKPKSIVWGIHIKQGTQISKGHWSATSTPDVRNLFLERLTTRALDVTSKKRKLNVQLQLSDFVESTKLTPDHIKDINKALLLKTLHPAYEPPSKDILSGHYLAQETAFVNQAMIKQLNNSKNLTIGSTLKTLAEENSIEGGSLKQWVDTRWHTIYNCISSVIRHKVPLEKIRNNNSDILNTSVQAILCTKAFFNDLNALAFVLYPIKMAILTLEL
ncbi:19352_t:CDS:2 [Dentiscutata erythropus]|uniref:19352_t:CDS:1 n=1 Tax=Dentiscutata erythropus TaxID=1348616 RepID=A0A9N8WKR6_9GLOM|nr:19352_t:CDS:2 [Dentiscutata erythropus]